MHYWFGWWNCSIINYMGCCNVVSDPMLEYTTGISNRFINTINIWGTEQNGCHFADNSFTCISLGSNWQIVIIGTGNGLGLSSFALMLIKIHDGYGMTSDLTHCGLVMPGGLEDLARHWFRWWLGAIRHQAITWTNVDLPSMRSPGIHSRVIFTWILNTSVPNVCLKFTHL